MKSVFVTAAIVAMVFTKSEISYAKDDDQKGFYSNGHVTKDNAAKKDEDKKVSIGPQHSTEAEQCRDNWDQYNKNNSAAINSCKHLFGIEDLGKCQKELQNCAFSTEETEDDDISAFCGRFQSVTRANSLKTQRDDARSKKKESDEAVSRVKKDMSDLANNSMKEQSAMKQQITDLQTELQRLQNKRLDSVAGGKSDLNDKIIKLRGQLDEQNAIINKLKGSNVLGVVAEITKARQENDMKCWQEAKKYALGRQDLINKATVEGTNALGSVSQMTNPRSTTQVATKIYQACLNGKDMKDAQMQIAQAQAIKDRELNEQVKISINKYNQILAEIDQETNTTNAKLKSLLNEIQVGIASDQAKLITLTQQLAQNEQRAVQDSQRLNAELQLSQKDQLNDTQEYSTADADLKKLANSNPKIIPDTEITSNMKDNVKDALETLKNADASGTMKKYLDANCPGGPSKPSSSATQTSDDGKTSDNAQSRPTSTVTLPGEVVEIPSTPPVSKKTQSR